MTANLYLDFQHAASRRPDHVFLDTGQECFSFRDMLDLSGRAAAVLRDLGMKAGDRLVAQVEKSPANVWLYLGCLRAGVVYTPLNTAYTAAECSYFIEDAQPKLLVCSRAVAEDLVSVVMLLTMEEDGSGEFADRMNIVSGVTEIAARADSDVAAILYTSGTTGRSKGAMLTHANLRSNVTALVDIWHWRDDDVLLHTLPIFHAHGLFVALHCALFRATTILFRAKFDAARALDDLVRASIFMGVPTFYTRLLALPAFDRASTISVRLFISGSAPLLETAHDEFRARTGKAILERYGMTEALMITSNPYDGDRIAGTVGFPLPEVSLRLAGEAPAMLEIIGPNIFVGYWRSPEKTAEAFTADGWFRTGDIATISTDGRVSLVGRSSDLIITGGYNVYPKEIELILDEMPGVQESAVIGVPHPDFGEAVFAVLTVQAGSNVSPAQTIDTLRQRLAAFKRPKKVEIVDALPRNAMGKVEKAALRRRFATAFCS